MNINPISIMQFEDFLKVEDLSPTSSSPMLSPAFSATTPSGLTPSSTTPTPSGCGSAISRRPSRKSTLTQQQKNQKRQRASQDQLNTLEIEFNRNPTPTATVRERIAQEINMTERSVQIWFQNRRAKLKNVAKKSYETGEECEAIPESMRRYLAMQALESGKPFLQEDMIPGRATAYGSGFMNNPDLNASKVLIYHLACRSLTIGTWQRLGQTQLDLLVFYSPAKSMMTYFIQEGGNGYRLEYPFSYIKNISLDSSNVSSNADGASSHSADLVIELNRPPIFTIDQGSTGWFQCQDFTEQQQASHIMVHRLSGHPKVLGSQLAKLFALNEFQNRHAVPQPSFKHLNVPVDPIGFRPSSQPNHLVHPRANSFNSRAFELNFPPSRGHKRQRSRSVPVAIDFSQLRPSKAPYIMHQHQHNPHFHNQLPNSGAQIYAPAPQYTHPLQQQHVSSPYHGPVGQPLSINTSACYGMDVPSSSLSTVSGTSPLSVSDFESDYHTTGPACGSFAMPFADIAFMSTMPEQSNLISPMSDHSQHSQHSRHSQDTIESPPVPFLQRSASASADPSCYSQASQDDEKFNFNNFAAGNESPSNAPMQKASAKFGVIDINDQKWFASEERGHLPKKQFVSDDNAVLLQDDYLYDTYLNGQLGDDPFLDTLRDSGLNDDITDSILKSFHKHNRSKASISTIPFRSVGLDAALSQLPPLPPPTPMEEFSFGNMANDAQDDFSFLQALGMAP